MTLKKLSTVFFLILTCYPLSSAAWYDINAASTAPNWSYRAPISISANAAINSTIKVDIDFSALISQLGVAGSFDINSPRIVRPDETLAATQEFTDRIYNSVIDPANNARGEIKFILQDAGPSTYYLYFDTLENGTKPINPSPSINGNFEHSSGAIPTNWSLSSQNANGAQHNTVFDTSYGSTYSGTIICNDNPINNADTSPNNSGSTATTTGRRWHLLGYRNNCEDGVGQSEIITLSKTLTVPATHSGTLDFYFQLQAYDSFDGNSQYDFFQITVDNTPVNHTQLNISNPGNALRISTTGIGRSNSFSTALVDAGWQQASLNLSSYANTTITISFSTHFFAADNSYRSWIKLDDLEWSVVTANVGNAEMQLPDISIQKTSVVLNDGISGSNPKRIPGATVEYTITAINSGAGSADNNTVVVTDAIPANTELVINSLQFTDGSPGSGMTATATNFSYSTDGINFSSSASSATTHIRVSPQGQFFGADGAGNPSFQLKFQVLIQ